MQGQGPQLPGAAPQPAGPPAPQPGATAVPQPAATAVPQPGVTAVPQPAAKADVKVFRLPGAAVAWWTWLILAVACLADVAATGRNHTGAEIAATLLLVTGVLYTCALRPRVIADSDGVTVMNPVRDHRIPWGSVSAVDLKESVQVHCVKEPGAKRGKVIHSWALYAQRRTRLRNELMSHGQRRRLPRSPFDDNERASEAQKISRQPAAQIMAAQLDDLATQARNRGAAAGPRVVGWAWRPATAILLPAILLVLVITVFR
jgi:hypothetical protein